MRPFDWPSTLDDDWAKGYIPLTAGQDKEQQIKAYLEKQIAMLLGKKFNQATHELDWDLIRQEWSATGYSWGEAVPDNAMAWFLMDLDNYGQDFILPKTPSAPKPKPQPPTPQPTTSPPPHTVQAMAQVAAAVIAPVIDNFQYATATEALEAALLRSHDLGAKLSFNKLGDKFDMGFDYTLVHDRGRNWARYRSLELVEGITATTRDRMRKKMQEWVDSGLPLRDLQRIFSDIIGDPKRAELIAATEVTRAFAQGANTAYKESKVVSGQQWQTARDEMVCPICGPLNQTIVGLDGAFFDVLPKELQAKVKEPFTLPPAHPRCRCWLAPIVLEIEAPQEKPKEAEKPKEPKAPKQPVAPVPTMGKLDDGFPDDLKRLEYVRGLGGSTGAELVRDPMDGALYVRKRGNSQAHLMEEVYADRAYKALGINVPDLHLYDDPSGKVKLSRFIDGAKPLAELKLDDPKLYAKALEGLRKDFAADALLGNWDVIGMSSDNVLVDKKGVPWRIDNGGCLRYRAQGELKKMGYTGYPTELWTMRREADLLRQYKLHPDWFGNRQPAFYAGNRDAFGGMAWDDIVGQMKSLSSTKSQKALLDVLPPEVHESVKSRLAQFKNLVTVHGDFKADAWKSDYVDDFSRDLVGLRLEGLNKRLPAAMTMGRGTATTMYDDKGVKWDKLRTEAHNKGDTLLVHYAPYIQAGGGDMYAWSEWASSQAGSSWSSNAQAMKWYYTGLRDTDRSKYHWQYGLSDAENAWKSFAGQYGEDAIRTTFSAMHAMNYEFMTTTKLPNVNAKKRTVTLMRTESMSRVLRKYNLTKIGDKGEYLRGAVESTSLVRPFYYQGDTLVEMADVPIHRVLGSWLFERYPGYFGGTFAGDHENELVALLEGTQAEVIKDKWRKY